MAHVAEIAGAIFVAITLVYLVIEIRINTEAVRASSYQQIIQNSRDHLFLIAADAELAQLSRRFFEEGSDALSPDEQLRMWAFIRAVWRNYENAYFQFQHSVLGEEEWETYKRLICADYAEYREYWNEEHKAALAPTFVALVESCTGRE